MDELDKLCKIDFPESNKDFNKTYELYKARKAKEKKKITYVTISSLFTCIILAIVGIVIGNYMSNNRYVDIELKSTDVNISNVTSNGFYFEITDTRVNIKQIMLISNGVEVEVNNANEITNLEDNTEYTLKITYSYLSYFGETEKDVEVAVSTPPMPIYDLVVLDNYVVFSFDSYENINYVKIDDRIIEVDQYEIIVKDLRFNSKYDYVINYSYLDDEETYKDSFTTQKQKEMTISINNPYGSSSKFDITFKTGDMIDIPVKIKPLYGLYNKIAVLTGFDKDISLIRSSQIVNAIYEEIDEKMIYSFSELFPIIANANIDDISKIVIIKSIVSMSDPITYKYEITDKKDIEIIVNNAKDMDIEYIIDYEESYNGAYYYVMFYINDCRYYISYNNDSFLMFNRSYALPDSFVSLIDGFSIEK